MPATAFAVQDERERLPPALEARIVARLTHGAPKAIAERPSGGSSRIPWLLAAAAILLAVAGWMREPVVRLPPPPDKTRGELLATPGTIKIDFTHTAATSATGDVLWHSGLQRGFMRIQGLAPNDPKVTQYQLWIFDADRTDEHPVDGGVFDVAPNEHGEVIVPIRAKLSVGRAKLFAVTIERPGGVVVSKRERIVLTASTS